MAGDLAPGHLVAGATVATARHQAGPQAGPQAGRQAGLKVGPRTTGAAIGTTARPRTAAMRAKKRHRVKR